MHAPRLVVLLCTLLGMALLPACHQIHLDIREGAGEAPASRPLDVRIPERGDPR